MPSVTWPTSLTSVGMPSCTATTTLPMSSSVCEPAEAADVIELAALGIESAAAVAVVRAERAFDLLRRQARAGEAILVEQHLILHRAAAEAGIVGDARNGPELRLDRPVLERLELGRRAVGTLQRVAVDQAGRRGQRLDRRRDPARQAEVAEPVEHLLPGEIAVGVLVERDVDVGQARRARSSGDYSPSGMPFISRSIGTVISRSTSSAEWPGHCVLISTIGGDRSG